VHWGVGLALSANKDTAQHGQEQVSPGQHTAMDNKREWHIDVESKPACTLSTLAGMRCNFHESPNWCVAL
jgi:hypothetical protein